MSNEVYYSGNKKKIKFEELFSSISNLPKSKFEEIVLGYFIFFDTNLYYDNQEAIHKDLFSDSNKIIFEKFTEGINSNLKKIKSFTKEDFKKSLESYEDVFKNIVDQIYDEAYLNISETTGEVNVESFLIYLADLEYNYRERSVHMETIKFINLLADPKRKQKTIAKKELELANQLANMEKVIHTKNDKYPLLGAKELEEVTNDLSDPNKALKPIKTDYDDLNELSFIYPSELIVIAGRPGMGKTSLALCMFEQFLRAGYQSIYFSCEMSKEQMNQKFMCLALNIEIKKYKDKITGVLKLPPELRDEWSQKLTTHYKDITLVDKPKLSIAEIRKYIIQRNYIGRVKAESEWKMNHQDDEIVPEYFRNKNDIKIIFIDYLQILDLASANPTRSITDKISETTTTLKAMCLENNLTVVLLSQLNRESQNGGDKRPNMAQLKGSGSIEQDADRVWLLHREDYYLTGESKVSNEIKKAIAGVAELISDKNRGGETGTVYLEWNAKLGLFSNLGEKVVLTDELDEDRNPISRTYSKADRIKEYLNLARQVEDLNKGVPQVNNKDPFSPNYNKQPVSNPKAW